MQTIKDDIDAAFQLCMAANAESLQKQLQCVLFGDDEDEEFIKHGGEFRELKKDGTHHSLRYYATAISIERANASDYTDNAAEVAEQAQQAIDNDDNDLIAMRRAIHQCVQLIDLANIDIRNVHICADWIQKIRSDPQYKELFRLYAHHANNILSNTRFSDILATTVQIQSEVTSIHMSMHSVRAAFAAKAVKEANACRLQAKDLFADADVAFHTFSAACDDVEKHCDIEKETSDATQAQALTQEAEASCIAAKQKYAELDRLVQPLHDVYVALCRDVSEPFALFMDGKHGCCDEDELVIMKEARATVEGVQKAVEDLVNKVTEYRDCVNVRLAIAINLFTETRIRADIKAQEAEQSQALMEAEAKQSQALMEAEAEPEAEADQSQALMEAEAGAEAEPEADQSQALMEAEAEAEQPQPPAQASASKKRKSETQAPTRSSTRLRKPTP